MAEKWLVIDDSATIQRVIKLAFQDYDVAITEAESVQDGLHELAQSPASLVIADAALSGVQSVQDFSRLQQSSPESAFIILEGSYDHIDENQFRGAGFRHFLRKPFDAQQLIAITREALGRSPPQRSQAAAGEFDRRPPKPGTAQSFGRFDEPSLLPPPPPGVSKSLSDELDNPFGSAEGFDLGLDQISEQASRAALVETRISHNPPYGSPRSADSSIDPMAIHQAATIPGTRRKDILATEEFSAKKTESSFPGSTLNSMLEPMLREEMQNIVRHTVEDYCRKHFAELTREFLNRELEKLASERLRLLVDK